MKFLYISLLCALGITVSCSKKVNTETEPVPIAPERIQLTGSPSAMMPKATAFRMSGDYANNVAVTLNANGTLSYFPAPTDITDNSKPYDLGDGWYLNRQGLGPNSVFTTYTFEEYGNLKETPTHQQLLEAVIPGAVVTAFKELPVSMSAAFSDPSVCNGYLK